MIVQKILQLPAWLMLKGPSGELTQFRLQVIKAHSDELRLLYVAEKEVAIPWLSDGQGYIHRDWIFLVEGINVDNHMIQGVEYIVHELYKLWEHFENPYENSCTQS